MLQSWSVVKALFDGSAGGLLPFEKLLDLLPPDPDATATEIEDLRAMQAHLTTDKVRQDEILRQADLSDLSDIYRPLGIDNGGYPDTEVLIGLVFETAERVGYFYKRIIDRPRPNAVDARLRPFIDVPPHQAFPSNHSFQMFSVAEVFSRILPEHPGSAELFYVAQRVAENREYAGLHYPSDTRAGRRLAQRFAPYLVNFLRREIGSALAEWR